jgi:hypothetical protein
MSSSGGAGLLELVARGKKDTFFTGDPQISFFHSVYPRASPWLRETRFIVPRNEGDFDSYVDFILEPVGDIIRDIHLLLNLPTWLPSSVAAVNGTSLVHDLTGKTYGWTNNCGYYAIQKVQLYQNQLMIFEDFGEAMLLRAQSKYTKDKMTVVNQLTGSHDGSPLGIQRNATPGQMEIRLNLPFDSLVKDFGIPIGAISPFSLRVRIYLNKLSALIESNTGALQPNVFNQKMTVQTSANGSPAPFVTKNRIELGKPSLTLRVQYVYVDSMCQKLLRDTPWTVPLQRCILNQYTLEDYTWKGVSTPTLRKLLEVYGSIQRLRVLFQTEGSYLAGQAWNYLPVGGRAWFSSLTFFIHGQDRLGVWDSDFFEKVVSYCHDKGQYVPNVYLLDSGAEDLEFPAGTLNLTQADKPELQFILNTQITDSRNNSKKTYLRVYADVWDLVVLSNQLLRLPYS